MSSRRQRSISIGGRYRQVSLYITPHESRVHNYNFPLFSWFWLGAVSGLGSCRCAILRWPFSLQWRHNERDCVSYHRRLDCLFNRWFRRRSKKTPKLHVTGLCEGIPWWLVDSRHKGPITRKMFPFDDVIMYICNTVVCYQPHSGVIISTDID